EPEAPAALDDFGDAVDRDHVLDETIPFALPPATVAALAAPPRPRPPAPAAPPPLPPPLPPPPPPPPPPPRPRPRAPPPPPARPPPDRGPAHRHHPPHPPRPRDLHHPHSRPQRCAAVPGLPARRRRAPFRFLRPCRGSLPPEPPAARRAPDRSPSELQSAFAGAVGHCLDAPVIPIPAAVEHDFVDPLLFGLAGHELAHREALRRLALPLDRHPFRAVRRA